MGGKATVFFYYDVVSPWARFAYYVLKRYREPWGLELVLRPRYLGGIMVASGNQPPATVLAKGEYMRNYDMPLTADYYKLPYVYPNNFPVNTINIIRLLCIIHDKEPQSTLEAVTEIFFEHQWGGAGDASEAAIPANFPKIIPTTLISQEKLKEYIVLSQASENKERMKNESAALAKDGGCFGFPWMHVVREDGKEHSFFGSDRFELMAFFLGGGRKWSGPVPDGKARL